MGCVRPFDGSPPPSFPVSAAYFERQKNKREREKARNPQSGELGFAAKPFRDPVPVHSPQFPFDRYEQWMVMLVDQKTNRLIGYQKLSQNTRYEKARPALTTPLTRHERVVGASHALTLERQAWWGGLLPWHGPISRPLRGSPAHHRPSLISRAHRSPATRAAICTQVALKFLAPKEGTVQYEIHCLCSAYLGADKKVLMKKTIAKKEEREEKTLAEAAEDEDDEEEEEEEPEGKWYYMGGNSFGELILNIIALAVAGVMLFNFLYAKGWWQKFCQPLLDWLLNISWPFLSFVGIRLEPGWLWFSTNVYDFHHIAFMFENLTAANTTNASISTKVRFNDTSFLNQDPFKQNIFNDPLNENLQDD